jgi:hypothetical protein
MLIYAEEGFHGDISGIAEDIFRDLGVEDKLAGVVRGAFLPEKDSSRLSVVELTAAGLGLMDWHRAIKAGQDTRGLENKIKDLLVLMVNDPGDILQREDTQKLMSDILAGDYFINIKKMDYEEIRDYIEAETAVLEAL